MSGAFQPTTRFAHVNRSEVIARSGDRRRFAVLHHVFFIDAVMQHAVMRHQGLFGNNFQRSAIAFGNPPSNHEARAYPRTPSFACGRSSERLYRTALAVKNRSSAMMEFASRTPGGVVEEDRVVVEVSSRVGDGIDSETQIISRPIFLAV